MRHLKARQLEHSKLWHMTDGWDKGRLYPVGYCAEHEGHATAKEAEACYHRWEADNLTVFTEKVPVCAECGVATDGGLCCSYSKMVHLCPDHRNREMWLKHTKPTEEAWES